MRYFFSETADAFGQFTKLFNFYWAAAPALWNLRWQFDGFSRAHPNATVKDIEQRFISGSEIYGADLRKAFVDSSWEEQRSQFASIMLTNAFSIYEYWAELILQKSEAPGFNSNSLRFDGQKGLLSFIREMRQNESDVLKNSFYPYYNSNKKYSFQYLNNYIKCYKYFKEARNAEIHNGGIVSDRAERAYNEFFSVSGRACLGMRGNLSIYSFVEGDLVKLDLRGVVGFCEILNRMMVTIDAELCCSKQSETLLEERLRGAVGQPSMLSTEPSRRHQQIVKRCRAARLPKPLNANLVYDFMRQRRVVAM